MFASLALLLSVAAAPSDSLPTGTQLVYRGRFVAEKGDAAPSEKNFDLTILLASDSKGLAVRWTTEERGRGAWSWLDRFGTVRVNARLRHTDGVMPTLLDQRPEGNSVVPLLLPFVTYDEPLAEGVAWIEDRLEHKVIASEKVGSADSWRIEVRNPLGRKRTVWVDKASPVVLAMSELVFIGQGEQHNLRYELVSREALPSERSDAAIAAFEEFMRLRERLEFGPQTREFQWTSDRLALLKSDLPAVAAKAKDTPLAKLAQTAEQESKTQKDRSHAIGALQGKLVGSPSPRPGLETISGEPFPWDDLKGKVTVLHFWEYRDMPLEEPYGQVAYLDYLIRKHAGGNVRMFGVVTDQRFSQPDGRRAGIQSAKRLHAFMNLSYPLLVDLGEAVKQFGDPRATGAKLPLFVVIDRAGKVVHYHVGHYEVNRDRGLEELEDVVRKALDSRG